MRPEDKDARQDQRAFASGATLAELEQYIACLRSRGAPDDAHPKVGVNDNYEITTMICVVQRPLATRHLADMPAELGPDPHAKTLGKQRAQRLAHGFGESVLPGVVRGWRPGRLWSRPILCALVPKRQQQRRTSRSGTRRGPDGTDRMPRRTAAPRAFSLGLLHHSV